MNAAFRCHRPEVEFPFRFRTMQRRAVQNPSDGKNVVASSAISAQRIRAVAKKESMGNATETMTVMKFTAGLGQDRRLQEGRRSVRRLVTPPWQDAQGPGPRRREPEPAQSAGSRCRSRTRCQPRCEPDGCLWADRPAWRWLR